MANEHVAPYLEAPGLCPDPIFVIGSPRSGTTALAQSLNRHPELRVGKESYVLHDFFANGRAEQVWSTQMSRVNPCWLAHEEVERDEFLAFIGLGFNALFSSRAEGKRWIDQTPLYTPMVGTLAAMFPGAKFLHIQRDGRHVVRSMTNFERKYDAEKLKAAQHNEIPNWSRDFRQACTTWATWVGAGLDFAAENPSRCITVRNEQIAADPVASFELIQSFLDLRRHPGPANFFGKHRINSSWVKDPTRPDDDDWDAWDRGRRREFVELAGPTMERACYGTGPDLARWADAGR